MVITTSGSIASFKTPVKQPLKSLKVYFSPIQNGSGDPSPSNVRPITGRTGLEVTRCGKNLFDEEYPDIITSTIKYRPLYVGNNIVTLSTNTPKSQSDNGTALFLLAGNVNSGASTVNNGAANNSSVTQTAVDGYVTLGYFIRSNSIDPREYNTIISIGSTATTYEPYSGTTIPVNWSSEAGTVYKGYFDVVSGNLVVTHKMITLTGSEPNAIYNWDGYCYIVSDGASDNSKVHVAACSHTNHLTSGGAYFESRPNGSYPQNEYNSVLCALTQGPNIRFRKRDTGFASLEDYQTYLQAQYNAGTPVQIVYELATPLVYSIAPNTVQTLIGRNNIFSDGDTVEAVYDHADAMDMVRLRQKVLKGCQIYKTVLPSGYKEYDYLQTASHNAKFDTGVSGADETLVMDFEHMVVGHGSNYGSYYGLLGNANPPDGKTYWCIRRYLHSEDTAFTKWGYCCFCNSTGSRSISPCGSGNTIIDKHIHYTFEFGKLTTVCDGLTTSATLETQSGYSMHDANIMIGTTSAISSGIASTIGRFYGHFKIWSHNKLIRDYVPAVRLRDNKAGFYDLVNYTFNPSIGSVDFVAGNDIGGLYVYADNSRYYDYLDTTVDANVSTDSDYFLTGFYDTGSESPKSLTVSCLTHEGHVCARIFNDKTASSVDYWNIATGSDARTYTTLGGRYIMATVYKPRAADFYIYDNTNQRYIVKGSNVT